MMESEKLAADMMESEKFAADMMESEKLPADMMFEILSRASFETVERSKAVSKGLRQIIYDPCFLPIYCKRTSYLFGYYFDSAFFSDYDYGGDASNNLRLPRDMQVLASCNHGILCCMKYLIYYVCKPATQQWQTLPSPKYSNLSSVSYALVVIESHPLRLRYNIVRLSRSSVMNPELKYGCEIFDSQNWKWEKTQGPTLASNELIISSKVVISVGESVFYITSNDNVLEFNIKMRIFRCFPLPESVCNNRDQYSRKRLVKYQGGLGCSCVSKDWKWMDVWVTGGQMMTMRWTRKMRVDMGFLRTQLLMPELVDFCSSDVAFMMTARGGAFCNFRDGSFREIAVPYQIMRDVPDIFRFQSDLEIVHLKGKMEEEVEVEEDIREKRQDHIWFPWIRRFFCL